MKTIATGNLNGFPTSLKTWDFLQNNTLQAIEALAKLAGNKTILTGCVVDNINNTVTSGFIAYNGEIIPFIGGGYVNGVVITTTTEQVNAVDTGLPFNAYFTKTATCGTPGEAFPFTDLVRLDTIAELTDKKLVKAWLPDNANPTATAISPASLVIDDSTTRWCEIDDVVILSVYVQFTISLAGAVQFSIDLPFDSDGVGNQINASIFETTSNSVECLQVGAGVLDPSKLWCTTPGNILAGTYNCKFQIIYKKA